MKKVLSVVVVLVMILMLGCFVYAIICSHTSANAVAETAATTETAAEGSQVSSIAALATTFLPLILIFVVFWFMLIRPQRKKDKQVKEMLNNLKAGDRICTIGGIYGTITGIKDDTITLSVGKDNLTMVVARWAIRSVEEVMIENDAQELN